MSNIYIQEPPTNGKVCLKTTVGDIDIELWSKECPKASRNFVQLCMEGYFDGTIFHRVVKEFIVQGGDPTGTGLGGESIYGQPFKDEFHSRLRFSRRGLVAMANSGANNNCSQFFFTLDKTQELQGKHTIFGQVAGDTLYNMLKLGECDVDKNERPEHPHKILSAQILSNPFPDIVPRQKASDKAKQEERAKKEPTAKATKNFNLLSFGDEAEEEEEVVLNVNKKFATKGKSAHDLTDDQHLSSEPAVILDEESTDEEQHENEKRQEESVVESGRAKEEVVRKLKALSEKREREARKEEENEEVLDEENFHQMVDEEKNAVDKEKMDKLKAEVKQLKKEMQKKKEVEQEEIEDKSSKSAAFDEYLKEKKQYKLREQGTARKTSEREQQTMKLLEKFKEKLASATIESTSKEEDGKEKIVEEEEDEEEENDIQGITWMAHKFSAIGEELRQAKDANVKTDESYDLYDPRHPINKRKRESNKRFNKEKEESSSKKRNRD